MEYKLCYIKEHKAYFTSNFEKQWGDDWGDVPYECNAGRPYESWSELIEDKGHASERVYKYHDISIKVLCFDTNDWSEHAPCTDFSRSPYSVKDINKGAVPWLWTSNFKIPAGTTINDFVRIIRENGGKIYVDIDDISDVNLFM